MMAVWKVYLSIYSWDISTNIESIEKKETTEMIKHIYSIIAILLSLNTSFGQQVSKSERGTFLLKNATIHTITKGTFVGDVMIDNGKISQVGTIDQAPAGSTTIELTGKHVYPGMIDGGTRLGLGEIEAVSLTNDFNELGDFVPHMQALTAVNPNSVSIPVTRTNGVTTVIANPSGGLFPGTAALINLHGYTPERMYAGFKGVILNFPKSSKRGRWDRRTKDEIKKDKVKAITKLNAIWDKAELYTKIDSGAVANSKTRVDYNPQMNALQPVVKHEVPLMINVNKKGDILSAIEWVKERNVKAIFCGVAEGYLVADELAEANIPVITGPTLSVPGRDYARYDVVYKNPGVMQKAGVKVALKTDENENTRNLPFNAGFAAAYGMGTEEALKAVTIVPAEIFGVADQYGSIEAGKVANLFVTDGDPFETKTTVEYLFIDGYKVPIESRHTLLYDEFLERDK